MINTDNDVKAEDVKVEGTDGQASDNQDTVAEEDKGDGIKEGGVDYKAELERVTKQLGKAEHKLEENRTKGGDSKGDKSKVDKDEVEKLASDRAAQIAKEQIDKFSTGLVEDVVEEGIGALAINADEATLIKFHYDNTIQKSGLTRSQIMNDLRRSKLLANESVIANQNTELAAALRSEQGKNKQGMASGERKDSAKKIVLTSSEEVLAQRMYERAAKVAKQIDGKPYTLEHARKELFTAKNQ